jgi:hypothetical protein
MYRNQPYKNGGRVIILARSTTHNMTDEVTEDKHVVVYGWSAIWLVLQDANGAYNHSRGSNTTTR